MGYKCRLIQAEDGEDFQEYVDEKGNLIQSGENVGVEIQEDGGEWKFYLLDDVFLLDNA